MGPGVLSCGLTVDVTWGRRDALDQDILGGGCDDCQLFRTYVPAKLPGTCILPAIPSHYIQIKLGDALAGMEQCL